MPHRVMHGFSTKLYTGPFDRCRMAVEDEHMLHAAIDESYQKDYVYIMSAIVATTSQLARLERALDDVIWKTHKAHGADPGIELHGQQLFQRTGEWDFLRGKPQAAHSIYRGALHAIAQSGVRIFIRGVRTDRLLARYSSPHPPHAVVMQHLLERLNDYASAQGERLTIVADEVEDQAHHEARMRQFQEAGTPGWRSSKLECVQMPFRWAASHKERGLQAADLVAFLYHRRRFHQETDLRVAAALQRVRDEIYPSFEHEWVWNP